MSFYLKQPFFGQISRAGPVAKIVGQTRRYSPCLTHDHRDMRRAAGQNGGESDVSPSLERQIPRMTHDQGLPNGHRAPHGGPRGHQDEKGPTSTGWRRSHLGRRALLAGLGGPGRFPIHRSRRKARSLSSRLPSKLFRQGASILLEPSNKDQKPIILRPGREHVGGQIIQGKVIGLVLWHIDPGHSGNGAGHKSEAE